MFRIVKGLILLFFSGILYSQSPDISYPTPTVFVVNQTIAPLYPLNNGGVIPNEPQVTTLAGSGTIGSTDAIGTLASFNYPTVVTFNQQNDLVIVDRSNHKIRKVAIDGAVTTLAGTGAIGTANGDVASATFRYPDGAIVDSQGNIFITDQSNHLIRKITPAGVVSTFAGSTAGFLDGSGLSAKFYYPAAMTIDAQDNLYIADWNNHKIRKITPDGTVTTYAGSTSGYLDGNAATAKFNGPTGLGIDSSGNLYVADYSNNRIRKIDTLGQVTTVAGSGTAGLADGNGSSASFNHPAVVAVTSEAILYVTDEGNHKIRRISPLGEVTTFAGTGIIGAADGNASTSSFKNPTGIAIASDNALYIADYGNHKIRKIKTYGYTIIPDLPDGLSFNTVTGEISGAPTVATPPATYTVTATNSYGSSSFVLSLEVSDNLTTADWNANKFTIYPNPIKDKFTISGLKEEVSVSIWTLWGQKIKTFKIMTSNGVIDSSSLPKGVYVCRITTVSGIQERMILKE
ncbi:T9SS type A sorting domain-containing protein [Flavobacterium enshiense]|uniref:T9SS type A sorting domain-containing protein n=1 Tax=Flavobacterium enshiense TaxID=1341165 RepID=UPI00345D520D